MIEYPSAQSSCCGVSSAIAAIHCCGLNRGYPEVIDHVDIETALLHTRRCLLHLYSNVRFPTSWWVVPILNSQSCFVCLGPSHHPNHLSWRLGNHQGSHAGDSNDCWSLQTLRSLVPLSSWPWLDPGGFQAGFQGSFQDWNRLSKLQSDEFGRACHGHSNFATSVDRFEGPKNSCGTGSFRWCMFDSLLRVEHAHPHTYLHINVLYARCICVSVYCQYSLPIITWRPGRYTWGMGSWTQKVDMQCKSLRVSKQPSTRRNATNQAVAILQTPNSSLPMLFAMHHIFASDWRCYAVLAKHTNPTGHLCPQ